MSQFEPKSKKGGWGGALSVFVRLGALVYSAVSQSAGPRRVRGTARPQAPPAQRETRGGKRKREAGGREGSRRGGVCVCVGGVRLRPNQIAGERCCHHRRAVCTGAYSRWAASVGPGAASGSAAAEAS